MRDSWGANPGARCARRAVDSLRDLILPEGRKGSESMKPDFTFTHARSFARVFLLGIALLGLGCSAGLQAAGRLPALLSPPNSVVQALQAPGVAVVRQRPVTIN